MHVILWEFLVLPDQVQRFLQAYKREGEWAQLFSQAEGYRGTELLSSVEDEGRFVTLDRWDSAEDFARFQERFGPQYRDLDAQFEDLTESETKLGRFTLET
jgi:heme-degrading monooxygenase HmoA